MRIQCPACGKQNEIDSSDPSDDPSDLCARCGCDLSALREIQAAAADHLSLAKKGLQEGAWAEALAHAQRSWQLVHASHSARVACLGAAAMGDSVRLVRWRARAEQMADADSNS